MTTKWLRRHTCQPQKVSKLALGWIYAALHPCQSLDCARSSWSPHPLSVCSPLSLPPIAALTVPHPPTKHPSSKHTHTLKHARTHTLQPTSKIKTRLFTKPENPERNHILPFKGCLKFPHRCCCLPFFIFISCKRFSPCSFPHLAQHSVTLFHFASTFPHPSISVPMITGRKFYPTEKHLLKSCWG